MPNSNDARSVTGRVLSILGSFTKAKPELTLSEIARSADLSLPTVHRRVQELVDWGALEKGGDGKIRIGMRLWELASLAPRGLPLRELALPYLEDLLVLTDGNSQLAVREGGEALFVERLRGKNDIPMLTAAANRLPLTLTAVGMALLAFAPKDVQDQVLETLPPPITEFTLTDPGRVRRSLAEVQRNGYAFSDQQLALGACSIAAPIYSADGTVNAAIGVVYTKSSVEMKRVIGPVMASARSLSRQLGAELTASVAERSTRPG